MNHLSFSQIDRYRKCGRQYAFIYLEGLRMPPGIALVKGSAVHRGIEYNSLYKVATREEMKRSDVVDYTVSEFEKRMSEEEVVVKDGEDPGAAKDSCVNLIDLYMGEISPTIQPMHVEAEIELNIDGVLPIKTVIDCIDDDERIRDYKTTGKSKTQADIDNSLQMDIYAMAYHQKFGHWAIGSSLDVLVETKTPKYQRLDTVATVESVARAENIIRAVQSGIEKQAFGPAPEGAWWCGSKFCGFWSRCEFGGKR